MDMAALRIGVAVAMFVGASALQAQEKASPQNAAADGAAEKPDAEKSPLIDYNGASAQAPHFDRKGLWPEDVKKTAYFAQKWEPARLLAWAKKGNHYESVLAAGNWMENDKPASKGPDENTDVVFPDADALCRVGADTGTLKARHITIGRNVQVTTRGLSVTGSIWVRESGGLRCRNPGFTGGQHSFARNDSSLVQFKMPHCTKQANASVEFLGPWGNADGLYVASGTMIIGPDSSFYAGERHQNTVCPKARLILMSGSRFQTVIPKLTEYDLDVFGDVLAGTPERPLTQDAHFSLNFKARGAIERKGSPWGERDDCGLLLREEGSIAVHSADPKRARLVFDLRPPRDPRNPREKPLGDVICLALLGKTEFNGVEFNNVQRGGIWLADVNVRKQWKNVFFGKGNKGAADELFAKFQGKTRRIEEYARDRFFSGDE